MISLTCQAIDWEAGSAIHTPDSIWVEMTRKIARIRSRL